MSQPSETAIAEVCEFASLDLVRDRALVISALRAKNGSIQDVVLSYYDDPLKFRQLYTWDETSFMGDRDTFNGRRLPSLNIQDSDYNGSNYLPVIRGVSPSNIHTAAPSRPPSRAQSPLSGLAEWNSSNAGHTSNISQEDKELQQALAESSAMSSMHAPPGVGSISNPHAPIGPQLPTHLPYFGSADRETYDPNQWAMVRRTLEPEEPGPSGRIRAEDAPAFLRSRQSGYGASTLGALLTILHAIPLARNSFLTAGVQPASYGQNSAWWKGASITPTGAQEPDQTMRLETIINADSDEDGIYERQSVRPEIARELTDEIHRLMAFLDSTARAYATADRIADSRIVQDCHGTDTNQKLFEAIQRLALPGLQQTFYSDVQLLAFGDLSSPSRCESYAILDLKVDTLNVLSGQSSAPGDLYSVMDNLYWENFNPLSDQQQVSLADTNMAVISRLAPVQILQLNASSTQHINEFDIPSVLYLDRYLDENKSLIADLQLQLQKVYKALQRVDEAIYETKNYIDQSGPDQPMIRDRVTLSEQAISFAFQKEWHLKAQSSWERYIALQSANKDTSTDTSGHEFDFSIADIDLVQTLTEDERNNRRSVQAEIAIHLRKLRSIRKKITSA
ncbi:hypothetical protein SEPCBS119000_002484 [Sporothrix epigloea]|uniref:Ubiquitin interaction motif protein n=1 Tax=Sporothrix epigloea TaxID=1892477 RepID=A0ABP0DKH9_9PEZI